MYSHGTGVFLLPLIPQCLVVHQACDFKLSQTVIVKILGKKGSGRKGIRETKQRIQYGYLLRVT